MKKQNSTTLGFLGEQHYTNIFFTWNETNSRFLVLHELFYDSLIAFQSFNKIEYPESMEFIRNKYMNNPFIRIVLLCHVLSPPLWMTKVSVTVIIHQLWYFVFSVLTATKFVIKNCRKFSWAFGIRSRSVTHGLHF